MPTYWEDENGSPTQLQVGVDWPERGGPAYAGSPQGWEMSPYVSHRWFHTAFSDKGGIWTAGLNSCSALVYLFGPGNDAVTHGALWHVNCSAYESKHSPEAALNAINKPGLELKFVVIGYNQDTQGVKMPDDVRGSIRDFRNFLERYGIDMDPWIYVGNDGSFGVNSEGYVGLPRRMAIDTISPRRQSLSDTMALTGGRTVEQTTICCSRCYITTAVCRSLGLGDDCSELRILRAFRDDVLLRTESGRAEVEEYYKTAPLIVAAIEQENDAGTVYACLHNEEIRPALSAIRCGEYERARAIYRAMYERLRARYL